MSEVVEGKSVRIRFDGSKCIHSRNCVLSLPQVFKANVEGPWIDPDAASAIDIQALAARCPSGAIVAERLDGQPNESASVRGVVAMQENGPYAVRGDLRLGGAPAGVRATLCRCGQSANKPYCDSSHVAAGFKASGEAAVATEVPAWGEPGPLEFTRIKDGPLKTTGSHEVTCASGHTVRRTSTSFLCRCGGSASKPFCDGSHRALGFTADGD